MNYTKSSDLLKSSNIWIMLYDFFCSTHDWLSKFWAGSRQQQFCSTAYSRCECTSLSWSVGRGVAIAAAMYCKHPVSAVCCRLHAYGVNVAANEDAGSVVRGARTHASRAEPINGRGSHHWLRSNFTPLSTGLHTAVCTPLYTGYASSGFWSSS